MSSVLDLEKLDSLEPDQTTELGKMIEDVYQSGHPYLERLAKTWDENIRFLEGDQHIYYNTTTQKYEVIPITRFNKFVPRPVTNYILPIVQTVASVLTRNKPSATATPNSTDTRDIDAAKLAERIVDAKWELDDEQLLHIKAAKILMLCGTVYRKDFWNPIKGGSNEVQLDDRIENVPVGDTGSEMIDPFKMIVDLQNQSYFIETQVHTLGWIRKNFSNTEAPYTGLADKVQEDDNLSSIMDLRQKLQNSTGKGFSDTGGKETLKGCAVVKECYIQPTEKHPKGMLIIVAGGFPLYVGDSPYYDERYEDSWHPYSVCKWEEIYFRFHGLSLVENLVPLQKRINAIDSLIILNRMQMCNPIWLTPKGCGVDEGYLSGAPGLVVPYNPAGANGAKPERMMGVGLPNDIYKERQEAVTALHNISGDNEVLQGQNPSGVNTAMQMQIMLEQSLSKFSPFVQQWEKFIEGGQSKKMQLIAKRFREPRPEFIKLLKSMNRENLDVEIADFVGADLRDNVHIRIEAGSSLPRSKIVEQQTYKELASMGMFGPIDPQSNPVGNQQFLEKFGVERFDSELNADVKRARWSVSVMTAVNRGEMGPEHIPMLTPIDKIEIHYKIVTDQMKQPSFKDERGIFARRLQEIAQLMAAQASQMAMQASSSPQAMPSAEPGMPEEGDSSVNPQPNSPEMA